MLVAMPSDPRPPYRRDSAGNVTEGSVLHADSNLLPDLGGRDITFIRIDHQTRLQVDEYEIVIESPFGIWTPHGEFRLDPADRSGLGPLLSCYPGTVTLATIDVDAALHIELADGTLLVVPPDEQYEAWQVHGPSTFLLVCLPGRGQVAVWV
jgi:hypothetical protein